MRYLTSAILLSLLVQNAVAQDLFRVDATAPGQSVTVTGSSIIDLAEAAIEASGDFAVFSGLDTTINLDYANLDNAIVVTVNAANTDATLSIPGIGFTRTFSAANRDALQNQIEDFLQQEGANVYADFLGLVRSQTLISVLDGNPSSATAVLSKSAMERHTLSRLTGARIVDGADASRNTWTRFVVGISMVDADGFEGTRGELDMAGGFEITDLIGISMGVVVNYMDLEGTTYVNGGFEIGLPIAPTGQSGRFSFVITPLAQLGMGGSVDAADGGLFYSLGVNATAVTRFDGFEIVLGAQFLASEAITIEIDDYEYDADLSQQLASFGGAVRIPVGKDLGIDAGAAYHLFLDDSAVDGFIAPFVRVNLGNAQGLRFRIGYRGEFADNYTTHGGTAELSMPF